MATISSLGVGSGLDIESLITKLMAVESQPLTALATKEATYQAKLSAFGSVKSALASLQTAAKTLTSASTFSSRSATSSASTVVTAKSTDSATPGTYNIEIIQRASNHGLASLTPYAETTDTFHTGTLSITVGGTTTDITIGSGNNTLDGIRQAINDADTGVSATIIHNGTTNRLVLTSAAMGTAGEMTISVADSEGGGTNRLDDLATGGATMEVTQPAADARLKINNVEISRSSNSISDAVAGLTFNLLSDTGTSTVTVARNTSATTSAIDAFVKAYNDAVTQMKSMTAYDATNKKASTLTGDSTTRGIQTQLVTLLGTSVSNVPGGLARLSDLGISVQKDGLLTTDSTKLQTALNNPDVDLATLFGSTTSGNKGIAVRFNEALEAIVGSSGLIANRTEGITASIKELGQRADAFSLRLEVIEKRYRTRFAALDTLIASMNQTSDYLTQQLASLASFTTNKK